MQLRVSSLLTFLVISASASYVPPYYEGIPKSVVVSSLDPPDFRGEEVYRIEFTLLDKEEKTMDGFIHRSWSDFQQFEKLLHSELLFFTVPLPQEESLEGLDAYMKELLSHPYITDSHLFQDFLGINWSGSDLTFMSTLPEFLKVVIPTLYRAPEFPPEPPVFDNEDDCILSPETPFEVYIYLKAFRSRTNLAEYLEYFGQFVASYPGFANSNGDEDDSDVQPAGVAVAIPPHFNQTYVHFLPGGYLNGHTVRLSYLGKSKFNFLHEELLTEWLTKLHGDKRPRRILDIGTGPGFSAFVLAQLFPEAEVVAIDLAAPYIRMARRWAELRNVSNVAFYHANAEDLSWLESDSFDLINYAYVLHEMPRDNAKNILTEIYRLLAPGGTMNGFEVPYEEDPIMRLIATEFNTWGHKWDEEGPKGPEPYMWEYEYGTELTPSLEAMGFTNVEVIDFSYFESVFLATK